MLLAKDFRSGLCRMSIAHSWDPTEALQWQMRETHFVNLMPMPQVNQAQQVQRVGCIFLA